MSEWTEHIVARRDRPGDKYPPYPRCARCGCVLGHDVVRHAWTENGARYWHKTGTMSESYYTTLEPSEWVACKPKENT